MREPRGHYDMFGGYMLDPVQNEAAFAAIFINPSGYDNQCGHGIICMVTSLLELNIIPESKYAVEGKLNTIKIETTVGLIDVKAGWDGERVRYVRFRNTPEFILYKGITVKTSFAEVKGDIVFNGAFNFFTEISTEKFRIDMKYAPLLTKMAEEIKCRINDMGL